MINAHESSCILPCIYCEDRGGFSRLAPMAFVRASWWGWYFFLYSIKNNVREGLGHLRGTVGLQGWIRKLGIIRATTRCLQSPSVRNYEMLDFDFCTYASVGHNTTAEADHRLYDVMVSIHLRWRQRLGVNLNIVSKFQK